jgi:hypothetical protein
MERDGEAPLPERPAGEETPAEMERLSAGPLAETPADEEGIVPAPVSGGPLMQGVRTAATITAGSLALEGVTLLANRLTGGHQAVLFFVLGMTIAGAGFLVLVLAAGRLPKRAQPPFWAMGILFVSICFLLAGQACGVF